jgi:hypothetical protein
MSDRIVLRVRHCFFAACLFAPFTSSCPIPSALLVFPCGPLPTAPTRRRGFTSTCMSQALLQVNFWNAAMFTGNANGV